MTTGPAVTVRKLCRYFGSIRAVDGLSFEIERGQVLGFIGANGAGKTTTMRIMAGLDEATYGDVLICGMDVQQFPAQVRAKLGWMPDSYGRYSNTTVYEYLDFYSRAYGFRGRERTERLEEVMEFTDLKELTEREIEALSKGMAQRLCLARMLLHDPEVLLMDEPAAGLDPKARVEFRHLVRLLAEDRKTVFISSHILSELEDMCDSILFIDKGRIVHHGATDELKKTTGAGAVYEVKVAGPPEELKEWVSLNPGVKFAESTKQGCRMAVENNEPEHLAELLRRMIQANIRVIEFREEERTLEDAFIDILERNGHKSRDSAQ